MSLLPASTRSITRHLCPKIWRTGSQVLVPKETPQFSLPELIPDGRVTFSRYCSLELVRTLQKSAPES